MHCPALMVFSTEITEPCRYDAVLFTNHCSPATIPFRAICYPTSEEYAILYRVPEVHCPTYPPKARRTTTVQLPLPWYMPPLVRTVVPAHGIPGCIVWFTTTPGYRRPDNGSQGRRTLSEACQLPAPRLGLRKLPSDLYRLPLDRGQTARLCSKDSSFAACSCGVVLTGCMHACCGVAPPRKPPGGL